MSFDPQELQEILSIYKAESEEHLQKLNEYLLQMEKDPGKHEVLEEVFREAHSLKGSARMIGFTAVEKIAHHLEDLFGAARKGELEFRPKVFDVIFASLDTISRLTEKWLDDPKVEVEDVSPLLERMETVRRNPPTAAPAKSAASPEDEEPAPVTGQTHPPPGDEPGQAVPHEERPGAPVEEEKERKAERKKPPKENISSDVVSVQEEARKDRGSESKKGSVKLEVEETIRVTTQKLDDLMSQIGEILVTKIKFDQRLTEIRDFESDLNDMMRDWSNILRQGSHPELKHRWEAAESFMEMQQATGRRITTLHDGISRFVASFNEDSLRLTLISSELQESINRVRMLPLSSLFNLFPRLLRDIVRGENKEVELEIAGGGIQVDKKILEQLKDPLTHLLRNAVDHGVEPQAERAAAGKDTPGNIHLKASQKASSVVIDIKDDGRGLDVEKIREIALRRGFVTEGQLLEMSAQQVMSLVFRPGFSTKNIITDLSGRGVGLDVVYTNIEKMKGTITLSSELGKGATFSIKLPVSLATSQALMIRVREQIFALPLTAVEVITEIGLDSVMTVESREAVLVEGRPTALVRLHELVNLPADAAQIEPGEKVPVVVIGATEEKVAMIVDEVVGEKEIVVKSLGRQLLRVKNVSGATILGDGSVVLILNVFDLIKSSQKVRGLWAAEKKQGEKKKKKPEIIVVDDSVTTRVLEKNILEGSGYKVTLAVDGVDALEKMKATKFDLVVTDIQMPRMDGFELTRAIRKEERFRELPVILVTSLDSEEDKKRGIDSGADAYITKGAFEQGNLLTTIKQLL